MKSFLALAAHGAVEGKIILLVREALTRVQVFDFDNTNEQAMNCANKLKRTMSVSLTSRHVS